MRQHCETLSVTILFKRSLRESLAPLADLYIHFNDSGIVELNGVRFAVSTDVETDIGRYIVGLADGSVRH